MDPADRARRVWLLLHRAYRRLREEGILNDQEFGEVMEVLGRLEELQPEEIRRRLAGVKPAAAEPPDGGGR